MSTIEKIFSLKDKVVLITGGAGLLGSKYGEIVAEAGGRLIIIDKNIEKADTISKAIKKKYNTETFAIKCNIAKEYDVKKCLNTIINKYNKIDVLINNAALDPKVKKSQNFQTNRLENFSLEQWNLEISVGLSGAMICSKIFGTDMSNKNGGVILNIASDLGIIAPDQRIYRKIGLSEDKQFVKPVTYSVIKHGIIGLTKYLSTYWLDKNIRVNSLSPGGVKTDQNEEFLENVQRLIPLKRLANEDEYKAAVLFMISDASSYMTGSNIIIDGGRSVW